MDYRTRWQQRRRREAQRRWFKLLGVVCVVLAVAALVSRKSHVAPVWSVDLGTGCPSHLAAQGDTLLCASTDGLIVALRLGTGRPLWPHGARRALGPGAAPAVTKTRVVCVSDDATVCALARSTGELVWEVQTGGAVRCPPLVAGDTVFAGSDDGNLYAWGLSDGAERWRFAAGSPINSGCALVSGILVFGTVDGRIQGVDCATGKARWPPRSVVVPVCAQPVADSGQVLVGADDGQVHCLDPATGRELRVLTTPGGLIRAAPVVDDQRVYVATTDGWVVAFERQGVRQLWVRRIGNEVSAGPSQDDKYLYCGNGTDRLLALAKQSGRVRRAWECPARVQGSLAVTGGLVVVATDTGRVMAFRTPTQ